MGKARTKLGWLPVLLLAGCTALPVPPAPEAELARWVGRPLADLVATWGAAEQEAVENGERVLFWPATRYGRHYFPANLDPVYPATSAGTVADYRCRAAVVVDADATIRVAEWRGVECYDR